MSQFFTIHPDNPNPRLIRQAAAMLRDGGEPPNRVEAMLAVQRIVDAAAVSSREGRGVGL